MVERLYFFFFLKEYYNNIVSDVICSILYYIIQEKSDECVYGFSLWVDLSNNCEAILPYGSFSNSKKYV